MHFAGNEEMAISEICERARDAIFDVLCIGHFVCLLHATRSQIDIFCFGAYGLAGGDS